MSDDETALEMLTRLGTDAVLWAQEFNKTAIKLGYSEMDEGWLIGWFANAIENCDVIRCNPLRAQLHSEIVSHADMQKAYEFQRDTLRDQRDKLRETLTTCADLLEKLASDMCPPNSTTPQLLMIVGALRQAMK